MGFVQVENEMLWIKNKRPKLNMQVDSIFVKLSTWVNALMLIYFITFNIYKNSFPLFLIYSFHNDDIKSSKHHVVLLSLIFLVKCFSKSFFIRRFTVIQTKINIFRVSTLPKSICNKVTVKNFWSLPKLFSWMSKQLFATHFPLVTRNVCPFTIPEFFVHNTGTH